jgi:predicted dehydrogenase
MSGNGVLTINGVKYCRQYVLTPDLKAGSVAFYEGASTKAEDLEAQTFARAIRGEGKLYVLPEEAIVVTKILEGIYKSAESGKPYYFD